MFMVSTPVSGHARVDVFGGWGVGWGGLITFSCTSTRKPCYAAARSLASPRMHHATLLYVLLHFHTYVMHLGRKSPLLRLGQALDRLWTDNGIG